MYRSKKAMNLLVKQSTGKMKSSKCFVVLHLGAEMKNIGHVYFRKLFSVFYFLLSLVY